MRYRLFAAALAATLLATSGAAAAQASASVTFSGIRFTLVDLDPDDGIDPTIAFTGASSADANTYDGGVGNNSHLDATTFAAPVWATVASTATNSATAWMLGDPYGPGATAHADGSNAASPTGRSLASIWFKGSAVNPGSPVDFTLSPHTEVILTGTVDGWASSDQLHNEASASMFVEFDADTSQGPKQSLVRWDVDTFTLARGTQYDMHHDISVSFVNDESIDLLGNMNGGVSVLVASSVPEPWTAAMLLAGAGLLAARRRLARPGRQNSYFTRTESMSPLRP